MNTFKKILCTLVVMLATSVEMLARDGAARGALFGGLTGATIGGIAGGGRGAGIGAAVGFGTGALIGSASDRDYDDYEEVYYEDNSAEIKLLQSRRNRFAKRLRAEQRKSNPSARKIRMYQRNVQILNDQIADLQER